MRVVLAYAGLSPGGVTADLRNLERGLLERGVDVAAAGSWAEVERQSRSPDCLVHVFSSMPSATTFGSIAAARARRRPLVWTPVFHPSRPRSWAGYGPAGRAMAAFDRVAPRAARLADGVIAATDAEADHFRSLGARLVETIPPAVDATAAALTGDARRAARAGFGLGDEPVVLMVARAANARRKGLSFASDAYLELRRRVPSARLLLLGYGDGPLAGLPGAVATGWVGAEVADAAYGSADALFVSSIYEGLPRAVVEGWSHELAPVVTDRVALAPLVAPGAGEVVAFGDARAAAAALERVVTDPGRARAYGAAGRAIVEGGFLLDDHVGRTLAMYHEVSGMIKTGKGAGRDHRRR